MVNRNAIIMIAAAAFFFAVLGFSYGTVFKTGCEGFKDAGAIGGCAEFFIYRYQALIGIGGAIVAALITARPVWRQLAEMARQSDYQTLDFFRKRSVELDREQTLIYQITSSLDIAARAIVNLAGARHKPTGQVFGVEIARFQGAESYLRETIVKFDQEIGPLWGAREIHDARIKIKEDAQRFANRLYSFAQSVAPGAIVMDQQFDVLGRDLAPFKTSVFAAAEIVHAGIVAERRRVSDRITALESRL
ncbi:MAG: hypothetical protein ACLPX7_20525 [Xanthobacteraceae bacterium]